MPKRLLPLIPAGLLVQQVLPTPERVTIDTSPRQSAARCPDCGAVSHRVHSRYGRSLADLPWQGRPVTLRVHARRFRCLNPACTRRTFAERLAEMAPIAARRTERLGGVQRCLGLALGQASSPDNGAEAAGLPRQRYVTAGNHGQIVAVMPSRHLVIVHLARRPKAPCKQANATKLRAMLGLIVVAAPRQ